MTVRFNTLVRVLRTQDVGIGNNQALGTQDRDPRAYSAIWDTGATNTCVTTRVVNECALTPITMADVTGIHGTERSNVYLIDVYLPNKVVVRGIQALEVAALAEKQDDVLIGMDILVLGDFAVSNFQGKTTFTFRIPSRKELDFVGVPNVGRNEPCPCGSGKKFKKCHGA